MRGSVKQTRTWTCGGFTCRLHGEKMSTQKHVDNLSCCCRQEGEGEGGGEGGERGEKWQCEGVSLGNSMGIPPDIGGHTHTHTCRYGFWTQMGMPK